MSKRYGLWFRLGAAAVAVAATAVALWCSRKRRLALAQQAHDIIETALHDLGVLAESRIVQAGDLQLHTILAGPEDGHLAILLHGFPECWYSWRHQIPALAEAGYRVAVPDQRGYNLSDKPRGVQHYRIDQLTADILAFIHTLGRNRATLIAHDWGGAAAWRFAMDYPEAVKRLVVMNAPHPVALAKALRSDWSQRLRSWYMFFFQLPWLPESLLTLWPRVSARLFFRRTAVRRSAFSDADLEVMAAALAQPDAMKCMIDWYRAGFRFRPRRRAAVIEAPTLVVWAEDDLYLGKALTEGLDRWVSDLEIHYIADCGHWVQNEAPDAVNEKLLAFLQRTE